MANKTGTMSLSLAYVGPLGQNTSLVPPVSVVIPYQAQVAGSFDVPDTTASGEVFTITLADAGIDLVTGLVIKNNTPNGENPGVDVEVKINGGGQFLVAAGGAVVVAMPKAPDDAAPITEVILTTATDTQVGPGTIGYILFGDPEPVV